MTSSPSENWQELVAGYILGNLSPEEAEAFKQVLEANPELNGEVTQLQEVLSLMPYALPEQEPSPHLRSAILQAAQATPRPAQSRPRSSRQIWWGIGGAVAALAVGALAVDNFRLRQEVQEARSVIATLKQPNTALYSMQGTGGIPQASGSLVVDRRQQSVVILVQNLPELPADQAYRLWAIQDGKPQPTYCGQFNSSPNNSTTTQWVLPESACSKAPIKMLITIESVTDPPVPKGSLVMQSSL